MSVKVYKVRGKFRDVDGWKKFEKEVTAISEKDAVEKAYTQIGGLHRVKRHLIRIEDVKEEDPASLSSKELIQLLSLDKLVVLGNEGLR